MTTLIDRTIRTQKENLRKLHNVRFTKNNMEYKLTYIGGLAEFVAVYGRRESTGDFKYVDGFNMYNFYTTDEATEYIKRNL